MALAGDHVGSRVRITTTDGVYEGILHAVDLNNKRLTLEKVTSCQTGKRVNGLYHFFQYEIKNVEIVDDRRKKVKDIDGPFLVTKKQTNPHLDKIKDLKRKEMLLSEKAKNSSTTSKLQKPGESKSMGPPLYRYKNFEEVLARSEADKLALQNWPSHYIFISKCDKVFREAIAHLQNQTMIGVAIEGVKMGRHGKISLIQVGTRSHVIVFDVLRMGRLLFDDGLGRILEYPKIQKVIHDCRLKSDALFHQYGVKLINVFDTQVAEVMVYRNLHGGDLPRYVQSYYSLLISYLDMESDNAFFYRQREEAILTDQKAWLSRPMSDPVLEVAVRHVMYLLQLRTTMMDRMLQDFTDGVDIYLGLVRDAPEENIAEHDQKTHLLPREMSNITLSAQRLRHIYESRYKDGGDAANLVDQHGFRENCIGPLDTKVIYSSDSIWHEGNGTSYQPQTMGKVLQECHRVGRVIQGTHTFLPIEDEEEDLILSQDEDDSLLNLGVEKSKNEQKKKKRVKELEAKQKHLEDAPFMTVKCPPAGSPDNTNILCRDIRLKERSNSEGDGLVIISGEKNPKTLTSLEQSRRVLAHGAESESGVGSDSSSGRMTGVSPGAAGKRSSPGGRGMGRSKMLQSFLKSGSVSPQAEKTGKTESDHSTGIDERFSDSPDDASWKSSGGKERGESTVGGDVGGGDGGSPTLTAPPVTLPGLGRGKFIGRGILLNR